MVEQAQLAGMAAMAGMAGTPPRLGTPPRSTAATYGTDRGSWLASLRERASSDTLVGATAPAATAPAAVVQPVPTRVAADSSWELDSLMTSAGRLDS